MSYFTQIGYSDTGSLDAFTRLRVSNPATLFTVQCQYNAAPLQMEGGSTGTGTSAPTHDANTRMVGLVTTAGTGTVFFQSYQYVAYQPGDSHLIVMTGVIGTGVAGAVVDFGYFDANNGVILRQNGASGLQLILRTSTGGSVSNANLVPQASWNIDPLTGTGPSAITLDITKAQILVIDLQFLGMGRVRVGFDINGVIYYVHQFLNANNLTVPYMQTATLPVQMLITTTGTVAGKTSYFKCAAVHSEGGDQNDLSFALSTPVVTVSAGSGVRTHLLSLRPKTTFNAITNREQFVLNNLQIYVDGVKTVKWELCLGQAATGLAWSDVNSTYSAFEYTSGAGTISGSPGIVLANGYVAAGSNLQFDIPINDFFRYPISLDRAGAVRAMGTLSLVVTGQGGASSTNASFNFHEIR